MVTGRATTFGNNVSHAVNRTRRRFYPNLRTLRVHSEGLGREVVLKVTSRGLRTLEKHGGLDSWLLSTRSGKLTDEALALKRRMKRRMAKRGEELSSSL
jgi:large subunit ribosomal protein L28